MPCSTLGLALTMLAMTAVQLAVPEVQHQTIVLHHMDMTGGLLSDKQNSS